MSAPLWSSANLFPRVASTSLGASQHFNASALVTLQQGNDIETIAVTFSSLSVLAAICGIYWFMVMRRNFRRDLILLLIVGDLWKSAWFGINAAVTLALGRPGAHSKWCLASGYMLFTGIESCDWAIFFQGLHLYLQVFPPRNSVVGHDGLYRLRNWVLLAWIIFPNISASLAFVNNNRAYVSQGGFCTLPIRPFWYRLALSWIPRYLIWIFIMWVAVRIYTHVGYEFKVFGVERNESSNAATTAPITGTVARARTFMTRSYPALPGSSATEKQPLAGDDYFASDDDRILPPAPNAYLPPAPDSTSRRAPAPSGWSVGARQLNDADPPPDLACVSRSSPSSRRGSRQIGHGISSEDFTAPAIEMDSARGSFSSKHSSKSSGPPVFEPPAILAPIKEVATPRTSPPHMRENAATRAMQLRRQAIQRQLRLLFIYPVVYMLMWIMPFVAHAMSYSDYYAQHPIFAIRILNIFFQCCMGFVDVAVFCWREKPWRHIPGSDGTFAGSFRFWQFAFGSQWHDARRTNRRRASLANNDDELPGSGGRGSRRAGLGRFSPWTTTHTASSNRASYSSSSGLRTPRRFGFSGVSDRRAMEVDSAHERLRLERVEWEKRLQNLPSNPTTAMNSPMSPSRKEWWESRLMSIDDD